MPQYLTPKELAEQQDVSPQTVTGWCRAGLLDGHAEKKGGQWVITMSPFLLASLPVVYTTRPDGKRTGVQIVKRFGRPKGSKNKLPYPTRCPSKTP